MADSIAGPTRSRARATPSGITAVTDVPIIEAGAFGSLEGSTEEEIQWDAVQFPRPGRCAPRPPPCPAIRCRSTRPPAPGPCSRGPAYRQAPLPGAWRKIARTASLASAAIGFSSHGAHAGPLHVPNRGIARALKRRVRGHALVPRPTSAGLDRPLELAGPGAHEHSPQQVHQRAANHKAEHAAHVNL